MKGIDNILKPLYDLWHGIIDKFSVKDNRIKVDGQDIVIKFIVENIKELTDEQCDALQCGDVVAKKTTNQFHCYKVTYKEDKHGLVLTYMDASLIEGQSYDYTEGHWVYNSEDITYPGGHTDAEVKALAKEEVESATSGTVADVLGLDSNGNLVKGAVSGGDKYYVHTLYFSNNSGEGVVNVIIKNQSTPIYDSSYWQEFFSSYNSNFRLYPASGFIKDTNDSSFLGNVFGVYVTSNVLVFKYYNISTKTDTYARLSNTFVPYSIMVKEI